MKKMTVTELDALTGYVVESVLNAKREERRMEVSNISESELNGLLDMAKQLSNRKQAAKKAYEDATNKLNEFAKRIEEKNHMGRFVYVECYSSYASEPKINVMDDANLFEGSNLEPRLLRRDVKRRLILKNLGSEVDVEKFIEELVKSY